MVQNKEARFYGPRCRTLAGRCQ